MSRIEFSKVDGRLHHPEYGRHHGHDHIRCDLARPAAELEAIAALMSSVQCVGDAMVLDATLYVKSDYHVPYLLQERSLHAILAVARQVLSEGIAALPEEALKPTPLAERNEDVYCRGASTYVAGEDGRSFVKYAMPKDHYGPGALLLDRDGVVEGHFLSSDHYERGEQRLALPLLMMLVPNAGIVPTPRAAMAEFIVASPTDGLKDAAAACMRIAGGMLAAMKRRVRSMQYEGHATAFLEEDNDARDVLLAMMAQGETLERTRNDDDRPGWSDAESRFRYWLGDGTEAPAHLVQRLIAGDLVVPKDGKWGSSTTLVAADGLGPDDLTPRVQTVSFDMFQNGCRFREHPDDGERECTSPDHHGYDSYCQCESCPLLDRVYEKENGERFSNDRPIDEDPAFEYHLLNERPDPMMVARHPNTRRSYAWRNAGIDRMHGIINQVLGSHFTYGIPMLVEAIHDAAVDQAVAEGWLVVKERNSLGSVAQVTDQLLGEVERQRAAREAYQAAQMAPTDA